MYMRMYASLVKGYIGFFGRDASHYVAAGMLGALACANVFAAIALIVNLGQGWVAGLFDLLKNRGIALVAAALIFIFHFRCCARYRHEFLSKNEKEVLRDVATWPGNFYMWGSIFFVICVSKAIR
ncbi:MAG: hypothetical protein QM696_11345 [Steroidobacteraceae bacterium]